MLEEWEEKGEDSSVVFVPPAVVVELLFSGFVFKLSPSKISSSFRVAPIAGTFVLFRILSILFLSPATGTGPSLLTTTFLLSTVLLSFSPRSFSSDPLLGSSRGNVEEREMEIARRRKLSSRGSGEEFLRKGGFNKVTVQ